MLIFEDYPFKIMIIQIKKKFYNKLVFLTLLVLKSYKFGALVDSLSLFFY